MNWMLLLSAPGCYRFAKACQPWSAVSALLFLAGGLIGGLYLAPADYQQGEAFRIIYWHVPTAFLSLMIYTAMAISASLALIFRIKIFEAMVVALPPIGAAFTATALLSGALWGRPMWGAWWVWDARLTSELVLLFLYLGVIAICRAIPHPQKAMKAMCILTLVGFIDIPIIHYSVSWWQTLHQGATLTLLSKPKIEVSMLWPLLMTLVGFASYAFWLTCLRIQTYLARAHAQSSWFRGGV